MFLINYLFLIKLLVFMPNNISSFTQYIYIYIYMGQVFLLIFVFGYVYGTLIRNNTKLAFVVVVADILITQLIIS